MKIDNWTERLAGTSSLPQSVQGHLTKVGRVTQIKAGEVIFSPAHTPDSLMFLYDGRIKVSHSSNVGREIVLYRITAGESCLLNMACILAEEAHNAAGVAETDVTFIALPKSDFDRLVAEEEIILEICLCGLLMSIN